MTHPPSPRQKGLFLIRNLYRNSLYSRHLFLYFESDFFRIWFPRLKNSHTRHLFLNFKSDFFRIWFRRLKKLLLTPPFSVFWIRLLPDLIPAHYPNLNRASFCQLLWRFWGVVNERALPLRFIKRQTLWNDRVMTLASLTLGAGKTDRFKFGFSSFLGRKFSLG